MRQTQAIRSQRYVMPHQAGPAVDHGAGPRRQTSRHGRRGHPRNRRQLRASLRPTSALGGSLVTVDDGSQANASVTAPILYVTASRLRFYWRLGVSPKPMLAGVKRFTCARRGCGAGAEGTPVLGPHGPHVRPAEELALAPRARHQTAPPATAPIARYALFVVPQGRDDAAGGAALPDPDRRRRDYRGDWRVSLITTGDPAGRGADGVNRGHRSGKVVGRTDL